MSVWLFHNMYSFTSLFTGGWQYCAGSSADLQAAHVVPTCAAWARRLFLSFLIIRSQLQPLQLALLPLESGGSSISIAYTHLRQSDSALYVDFA
jgi:hypothetical protein